MAGPKPNRVLEESDPRHGTANGYVNLGCRCVKCREANRRQHAEYMSRVRSEGRTVGIHGSSTCYESGCRCVVCTTANTRRGRARRYSARRSSARSHETPVR